MAEFEPPGRKQRSPFLTRLEPGKFAWCRCGRSASYPCCDGSHRGSDITPLKVVIDKAQDAAICACGESCTKPFCDGSHRRGN